MMEVRLGGDVGWCWLKGAGVGWCGWCSRRYWSSSQGVGSRGGGGGVQKRRYRTHGVLS